MAAHRRLLVSARRHPDRRLLAIQPAARGPVAPRQGRRVLSRKRLSVAPAKAGSAGSMKPRWGHKPIATPAFDGRSEEHTSELQSLMRISYAVFGLQKKSKKLNDVRQLESLLVVRSFLSKQP